MQLLCGFLRRLLSSSELDVDAVKLVLLIHVIDNVVVEAIASAG